MIKAKLLIAFLLFCSGSSIMAQDLTKTIETKALAVQSKLVEWRRHLHEHPELGNREFKTAAYIIEQLKDYINDVNQYELFDKQHKMTILDFIIFFDTQGYNSDNPIRLNNKTLRDLENVIRKHGGNTAACSFGNTASISPSRSLLSRR